MRKRPSRVIPVGTQVTVKSTPCDWGYVKMFDGEHYHVAMFGDNNTQLIFNRDELVVQKTQPPK